MHKDQSDLKLIDYYVSDGRARIKDLQKMIYNIQ